MQLILTFNNFNSDDLKCIDTILSESEDIKFNRFEQNGFDLNNEVIFIICEGIKIVLPLLSLTIESLINKSGKDPNKNMKVAYINGDNDSSTKSIEFNNYNASEIKMIIEAIKYYESNSNE